MSYSDPCEDIPIRDVGPDGSTLVTVRTFRDVRAKVRHLADLAREGARRADRFGVAHLARKLGSLPAIHAWIRDNIKYADEPEEKLETPAYILSERFGDCDGQHTLEAAMVLAIGGSAALVLMGGVPDDPAHVTCAVREGGASVVVVDWYEHGKLAPPGWAWAETTLRAEFGETPIGAAHRLGAARIDLAPRA